MVGEAEVLFIAPRHPNKGIKMTQPMTWKEAWKENLDEGHRGTGTGTSSDSLIDIYSSSHA